MPGKVILTSGQILSSGAILEPIRDPSDAGRLHLLLWKGRKATSGARVTCEGQLYQPETMDPTTVRALALPDRVAPFGSVRELLRDIGTLISQSAGLPERFVSETERFILATHFADATPSAPWLSIVGPETIAANQLFQILAALCRHALPLSMLKFSGICSLPTGLRLATLVARYSSRSGAAALQAEPVRRIWGASKPSQLFG